MMFFQRCSFDAECISALRSEQSKEIQYISKNLKVPGTFGQDQIGLKMDWLDIGWPFIGVKSRFFKFRHFCRHKTKNILHSYVRSLCFAQFGVSPENTGKTVQKSARFSEDEQSLKILFFTCYHGGLALQAYSFILQFTFLANKCTKQPPNVRQKRAVPEIIDTVFAKTSPKLSFSMTKYERFGLVFTKTRVYKFGHLK